MRLRRNDQVLNRDEKYLLNAMDSVSYSMPDKISQYLSNWGNFSVGGETYEFELRDRKLGVANHDIVPHGYLVTDEPVNRTGNASF